MQNTATLQPTASTGVKRSVGKAVLFSLLSFGLYSFPWFFRVRQQLDRELGKEDQAVLHTVGLLVPLVNIYLVYVLWNDLNTARTRAGLPEFNVVLYLLLSILVPFAALYTYPKVAAMVNEYWDRRSNGMATEAKVSKGEIASVVAGLLMTALMVVAVIAIVILAAGAANEAVQVQQQFQTTP